VKVYIAAKFQDIREANMLAGELANYGFPTCSRWLNQTPDDQRTHGLTDFEIRECAERDLEDIMTCGAFILLPTTAVDFSKADIHAQPHSGGKHFETGFAYARGKPIVLFGDTPRENVFHYMHDIYSVTGFNNLLAVLRVLDRVQK